MQGKISLQELIALNNTQGAKNIIKKYGLKPAKNYDELVKKLFYLTKQEGEEALKELANLHPHKDLILNYFCIDENKYNSDNSNITNECNCPSCQMARMKMMDYSNMDYSNIEGNVNNDKNNQMLAYLPPVLIGVFVGIVLVSSFKNL